MPEKRVVSPDELLSALKRYLAESGDTEEAVASQIGVNHHTLRRWLSDRHRTDWLRNLSTEEFLFLHEVYDIINQSMCWTIESQRDAGEISRELARRGQWWVSTTGLNPALTNELRTYRVIPGESRLRALSKSGNLVRRISFFAWATERERIVAKRVRMMTVEFRAKAIGPALWASFVRWKRIKVPGGELVGVDLLPAWLRALSEPRGGGVWWSASFPTSKLKVVVNSTMAVREDRPSD